jgi:hypothetical protein
LWLACAGLCPVVHYTLPCVTLYTEKRSVSLSKAVNL